jgi:lanthanide-dependent methanol dehydrogenase
VFARDVDTGQARWAMQTTPNDEWDYDATNEVILFDKDKKTYATQINKNGFIYTWQADNGTLIAAEKVHPFVNWATGVDLRTGVPAKDPKYSTHQDYNMKSGCPSSIGAKGVNPAAYSPKLKLFFAPINYLCMTYEPVQSKYVPGQPWVGATITKFPATQPGYPYSAITALDAITYKAKWSHEQKYVTTSGLLATAGSLVFYNAGDRFFKAKKAETGEDLWQFQVGSPIVGNPFSYQNKGRQYIGVMAGLGGIFSQLGYWGESTHVACSPGMYDHSFENGYTDPSGGCYFGGQSRMIGAGSLHVFSL